MLSVSALDSLSPPDLAKKLMRILILNQIPAPAQGEMNYYVLDVAARLQAAGDAVGLVHGRQPESKFLGTGYIFDHLQESLRNDDDARVRLEAIVHDFDPDIVQIHGVTNVKIDGWLAALKPTVRFVHTHRFYCSGQNMTWQFPRRSCELPHAPACLLHHVLNRCGSANPGTNFYHYRKVGQALQQFQHLHGLQTASRSMLENLVRNGIPREKIELLPLYAPAPIATNITQPLRRIVLHHGGLQRKKGVWLLAKNLDQLPDDVAIVFAAGGELQPALEHFVKHHHLGERIRIMGDLTPLQWSQLYRQAALVVIPSMWNEPLGLAGIYAMSHSKPVVAFESGGIPDWLANGENGVTIPFCNKKLFLQTVKQLLNEPSRLAEMGARGREIWEQKFQPQHHVEKLRAYYERIIRG